MTTRDRIVATGQAVVAHLMRLPKSSREIVYSTREIHAGLDAMNAFEDDAARSNGWKLLAKLADYEFPGVRRGEEQPSAWKSVKRKVRPLEWHRIPSPDEMAAWVEKVRNHKGAGPVAEINAQVQDLQMRVEALEKSLAEALGTVGQ